MSGHKRPMGEQAVPQWQRDPWMPIPDEEEIDWVYNEVCKRDEMRKAGIPVDEDE